MEILGSDKYLLFFGIDKLIIKKIMKRIIILNKIEIILSTMNNINSLSIIEFVYKFLISVNFFIFFGLHGTLTHFFLLFGIISSSLVMRRWDLEFIFIYEVFKIIIS